MNTLANGLNDLEDFLANTQGLRAEFVQTTQPAPRRDGVQTNSPKTRLLRGSFELARGGQFKFQYKTPFEQLIVSDGQTLWVHDLDLNQVTKRRLSVATLYAPALAVASARSVNELARLYDLVALPDANGMRWVRATPRPRGPLEAESFGGGLGGPVALIELGFAGERAQLGQLVTVDLNGQRTTMAFDQVQSNVRFPANQFKFVPPQGAEVLGQ